MTEPLPNWRSIWDRAPCRAVSLAFKGSWLLMHCTLGAASDGANTCAPFGTQLVQLRDFSVGRSSAPATDVSASAHALLMPLRRRRPAPRVVARSGVRRAHPTG